MFKNNLLLNNKLRQFKINNMYCRLWENYPSCAAFVDRYVAPKLSTTQQKNFKYVKLRHFKKDIYSDLDKSAKIDLFYSKGWVDFRGPFKKYEMGGFSGIVNSIKDNGVVETFSINKVNVLLSFKSLTNYDYFSAHVILENNKNINWFFVEFDYLLNLTLSNSNVISNSGNFDFPNPASAEARSIFELYCLVFVKLILMFIFLYFSMLAVVSLFLSYNVENKKKINNYFKEYAGKKQNSIIFVYEFNSLINSILIDEFGKFDKVLSGFGDYIFEILKKIYEFGLSNTYWVYNSKLEFLWTLIPCIFLLIISLPSFTLALALDETNKPDDWIKIIGNQWFWVYEDSKHVEEDIVIYCNIVHGGDLSVDSSLRALQADSVVTIANNKYTRLLVTSTDVIHSLAIPAMGVKIDACPGRINAITILPTRVGVYYGQCSEICGVNHAFMPIIFEVVA